MDLELSDDQFELRDNIRSVLEGACPLAVVRAVHEGEGTSAELWAQMTELYWPALGVAEDAGGLGLSFVEVALLAEELGIGAFDRVTVQLVSSGAIDNLTFAPVPEPGTLAMLALGLTGLASFRREKRK